MSIPNWWGDWRQGLTPHTGNLQSTDLIECTMIVAGQPVNTVITGAQILGAVPTPSVAWGSITGTLSSQTDLSTALSGKASTGAVTGTGITMSTARILGRSTAGTGAIEEITIGSGLTLSAGTLTASGGGLTVGTTAIASGTVGRILFQGTGNVLQQSANLFWDNTNSRLGVGGSPGAFNLDVNGTARVQGDLSVTAGAIKSIVSSVTSQFTSYNPSNNYPRCQFQVGQNASDVNAGLTIAPLFSSTGVQKPAFIQVSTNKNISDTGQFSAYFTVNTSLFTIGTNKQDGQVAGGVPIVFSPANTEALRIQNNGNIGVNTTTDAGYKLDVNGTSRFWDKVSIGSPSATSAVMEITSTTKGFLPPRMTTAQKNAIATPAAGLVVYDTTLNKLCVRTASAWETITSL